MRRSFCLYSIVGQYLNHRYCEMMKCEIMRFLTFLLCIAFINLPANSHAAERKFAIGNFENVQIDGDVIVNISTDTSTSARAKGSKKQLDNLKFDRNGRTLKIIINRSNITKRTQDKRTEPLEIFISTRRLKDITIRGNASVTVNKIQSKATEFLILGAGMIDVGNVDIGNLNISIQGSGSVTIKDGTVTRSDFLINGNGNIQAANLVSEHADIVHQGSASTIIEVSKVADINNNGTGRIEILGKGNCIIKSIGSGRILCDNRE